MRVASGLVDAEDLEAGLSSSVRRFPAEKFVVFFRHTPISLMNDNPPPLDSEPANPVQQFSTPQQNSDSGSGKKTAACCGIGCLVAVVAGVVLTFAGISYSKKVIGDLATEYTSDAPVEIVAPEFTQPEIDLAVQTFDTFAAALAADEAALPLVLGEKEINAILFHHPKFSGLSQSAIASISDNQLSVKSSFDLEAMNIPIPFLAERVEGKFFNGEITVSLDTAAGRPAIFIENIAAGEKAIPQVFIDSLRNENLLQNSQTDPEMKKFFDKIKELKIENNQLIIIPTKTLEKGA